MTWYNVVGIVSTIALALPVISILVFRLAWYKSFPALLVYYLIVFGFNFVSLNFVQVDKNFIYYYGVANNFLDMPLIFSFMTYFSKTVSFRKRMKMIIPIFLLFEVIVVAFNGFNVRSSVIVVGPGLLLTLIFSIVFFVHQVKITIIHQKAAGKAFIVTSLLFAYGGYSFIYVVYYLIDTPYKADTFLVYYLVNIFSSLIISTGIFLERKRVRQLAELQITRRELKVIYGRAETNTAASWKRP